MIPDSSRARRGVRSAPGVQAGGSCTAIGEGTSSLSCERWSAVQDRRPNAGGLGRMCGSHGAAVSRPRKEHPQPGPSTRVEMARAPPRACAAVRPATTRAMDEATACCETSWFRGAHVVLGNQHFTHVTVEVGREKEGSRDCYDSAFHAERQVFRKNAHAPFVGITRKNSFGGRFIRVPPSFGPWAEPTPAPAAWRMLLSRRAGKRLKIGELAGEAAASLVGKSLREQRHVGSGKLGYI